MNIDVLEMYFAPFAAVLPRLHFRTLAERYYPESFGNALVELDDGCLRLRLSRDRDDLLVDIGTVLENQWYNLDRIVRYLDGDAAGHILIGARDDKRLAALASWFEENYSRVRTLFTNESGLRGFQSSEKTRAEKAISDARSRAGRGRAGP